MPTVIALLVASAVFMAAIGFGSFVEPTVLNWRTK